MASKKISSRMPWPAGFTDADRKVFERIRVPAELVVDAGVRRVTDREAKKYLLKGRGDMAGLLFPYIDPHTDKLITHRVRRDNPEKGKDGKPEAKYLTPSAQNAKRILYYPPNAKEKLDDPEEVYFVLVEAEKSVLALTAWAERKGLSNHMLFVGMGGCWGWSQEKKAMADFAVLNGHKVLVLLDANVKTNPAVSNAQEALIAELRRRKCDVYTLSLPQLESVNGPDDLLAQPDGDTLMTEVFDEMALAIIAPFSDDALATRFADEHKDNLRYVKLWGKWLIWRGQHWEVDYKLEAGRMVQDFCLAAASECVTPAEQKRIRSSRTIEAVQHEASKKELLAAMADQWDADVWLLATPEGTADLRTGNLRVARREDYCTKLTGVQPNAKRPILWLQFLKEITQGDKELQEYLQRVAGYCLTGDVSEQALFFLYGTGANGKSVYVNTLLGILGSYASVAAMDVFTATNHAQHPTSIAALRGARLVAATETEDGNRWAEAKLKEMTGGTRITARFMRKDEFTFMPQFKPVISGNHRPKLRNVDEAMRRRIHLVPFNAYFPRDKRDPKLTEKLQAEWAGIFQWAIEGCLAWQQDGLKPPSIVTEATEDYFAGQDVIGNWLEEATVEDRASKTLSALLHRAFADWAGERNEYKFTHQAFSQKLIERGFLPKKTNGGERYIVGLRLKPSGELLGAHRAVVPINANQNKKPKYAP